MLRVRVEIIPWGQHDKTEVMYEAYVANDGSAGSLGANEGGRGNYDISLSDLAHLSMSTAAPGYLGRLEGVDRTPWHRITMARTALQRLEAVVKKLSGQGEIVGWREFGDPPNKDVCEKLDTAIQEDLGADSEA